MRNLKLEELIGYLPYQLVITFKDDNGKLFEGYITEVNIEDWDNYGAYPITIHYWNSELGNGENEDVPITSIKPILKNINKHYIIDGVDLIPLYDLFLLCCEEGSNEWRFFDNIITYNEVVLGTDWGIEYDHNSKSLTLRNSIKHKEYTRVLPLTAINYLYKNHIDFNNLIERGLAIESENTEPSNPYT